MKDVSILKAEPPRKAEDLAPFAGGNMLLARVLLFVVPPVFFGLAIWRMYRASTEGVDWVSMVLVAGGFSLIPVVFGVAMLLYRHFSLKFLLTAIYTECKVLSSKQDSAALTLEIEYVVPSGVKYQGKAVMPFTSKSSGAEAGATLPLLYAPEDLGRFIAVTPEAVLLNGRAKAIAD